MSNFNALKLRWTFGFNVDGASGTLVDLTADGTQAVFYSVGHTGVIFDYEMRHQRLLQGHTNTISCAAASDNKKWLATGDMGESDTMIVIWNSRSGVPVRTIFGAHPGGVLSLDMTHDAMFIATLGAGADQSLKIWEWTIKADVPVAESEITSRDVQHCVAFRRDDTSELVTNGSARTIFWTWCQSTCISFPVLVQQEGGPGHRIVNPPLAKPLVRQDGTGAEILLASDFSEGVPDTHR
jgi:WD40 repeat protein